MLSFFPRGVLDEILNLIESVSEGFPSYSFIERLECSRTFLHLLETSFVESPGEISSSLWNLLDIAIFGIS